MISVQSTFQSSTIKLNIDTTHLEEGRILQIDFTAHASHVIWINSETVDLPNLKEKQGIPEPYSFFNNPYKLQLQVSFWARDLELQIIYVDKLEGSQFNPICLE